MTRLIEQLRAGQFVVTTEVSPPVSVDAGEFIARVLPLKGLATAVNVTDGAGARAHLPSLVASHFLVQNGIEPILQMTCRDRNRIALQGDLLGAVALGIHNILILRGDDPKAGDQPDAKPVFDLESTSLLATAQRMRSDRCLPTGTPIKGELELVLGAADMPIDPPPGWTPTGLLAKIEAGADFAQTQFCMDLEVLRRYMERLLEQNVAQRLPILVGIAPVPSARSARWMREKLYGTLIPDGIVDRLERANDPKAEGKRICIELMQAMADIPGVAGVHIMAPQNPSAVPEVIAMAGISSLRRAAM